MKNKYEKSKDKFIEDANNGKRLSPLKAIRVFCLECMGYYVEDVKNCTCDTCPNHKFRFGKNETGKE